MGQNDLKIIAGRLLSVAILMSVLFLTECVGILSQRRSDPWLYERAMEEAEAYYVQGRWYEAYRAYREALSHHEGDEKALEGLLLSTLEAKKAEGDPEHIIKAYKKLFSCRDQIAGDMDFSELYFECADYYLKKDDPMGAVELLEEGMKIFPAAETVEEMREKKEDILAHTQVKGETWYSGVGGKMPFEKTNYWEYDGDGRVVLSLNYRTDGGRDYWSRMEYDENGNMVCEEFWKMRGGGQKVRETHKSYDENGNLIRSVTYNLPDGDIFQEANYVYDEEGNEIYGESAYYIDYPSGRIDDGSEHRVISEGLVEWRKYGEIYKEESHFYRLETDDGAGNRTMSDYDADIYTVQEVLNGIAVPEYRYLYRYDEKGRCVAEYKYLYGYDEEGKRTVEYEHEDLLCTWEYDENGNMVREVSDNGNRIFEIYYNDKNLPVRKEWYHISGGMRIYDDVEYHRYDETGRRTRMSGKCSVIEYDRLENPVKEYKRLDWESVEDKIPDKVRIYKYHYTGG